MTLDAPTCSRARRSRDARFDGRFFVGVLSTGIYCRPVCPAPSPREHNVRYFESAAAAAEAGLRPCLRCRPETAPFSAAWLGTERTVTRALRLIDDVAQGDDDVERLAERVGVTSRHLRRLFVAHLGASPGTVARTRRLQLAKTLVDETALPLAQVALAAGYGTVRRFNAAFQAAYGRPPSALRRSAVRGDGGGRYTFRLRFRPPYAFEELLGFLRSRAIPGVESVDETAYRRTFQIAGQAGWLDVRPAPRQDALLVGVQVPDPAALAGVLQRLRRLFDLGADPALVSEHLGGDALLAPLLAARPGLRVPGAFDGFELAVRAVLGQQVSVKGAATLAGRIAERFGRRIETGVPGLHRLFPDAATLAGADLAGVGLTQRRAATLRDLARAVDAGKLALGPTADPEQTLAVLVEVPGIGEWTAQYVALRALGEPDAFPAGDLWLRRAAGCATERELLARAEAWRPWRAYAALHLWASLGTSAGAE